MPMPYDDRTLEKALGLLADKLAVADVVRRRTRGADRFDEQLMRSCHDPDARESHGLFEGVASKFIDGIVQGNILWETLAKSHNVSNILAVRRGDTMFAESYHVVRETMAGGEFAAGKAIEERRVGYRYLDLFGRAEGQWRFISRETVNDWSWRVRRPKDDYAALRAAAPLWGTRDLDDPLYRMQPNARGGRAAATDFRPAPAGDTDKTALMRLLDKQAIAEACLYVARGLDRDDRALIRACLTDERAFPGWQVDDLMPGDMSFHFLSNGTIEFLGADEAAVRTNFVRWSAPQKFEYERPHRVVSGWFLDRFCRVDSAWLIDRREVRYNGRREERGEEDYWTSYASRAGKTGVRGAADPVYDYCDRGVRPPFIEADTEIPTPSLAAQDHQP